MGATDLVTKPIDWDQLLEVINIQKKPAPVSSPILVVEDDATNRGALCRVLRREGFEVLEAVDGNVAMSLIETESPGLIILDLILPECNGFDLIAKISQNGQFKQIPIIVVTAKDLSSQEQRQLKKEVDCIFQKGDYSRSDLLNEIETLMAKQPDPA